MTKDVKNILVIRIRAFGDTLLTTPLLRGLKKTYPQSKVTVLVEPAMRQMLENLPYVDAILPFDRSASKKQGKLAELATNLRFWRFLHRQKYDLVLDVLGTPRTAWMTLATAAPVRLGFGFRVRKWAYTKYQTPQKTVRYMADYNSDLLRLLGREPDHLDLDFAIPAEAKTAAEDFFVFSGLKGKKVVAIAPAGGWWLKRLSPETFRAAAETVCEKLGAVALIVWGPGEEELAAEVAKGMRIKAVLAPPSDFALMAALLKRSKLLLTNDGATKHLAVAVGCPSVTAFGPTNPDAWHPPHDHKHVWIAQEELECRPCDAFKACPISTHACLAEMPASKMADAALALFHRLRAKPKPAAGLS